jgi:stress response protein YsnF
MQFVLNPDVSSSIMSPTERMPVTDQRLIACTVYDQQNDYVGIVIEVNRVPDNQFSLLVQTGKSQARSGQVRVAGEAIRQIDADQKRIVIDRENYSPTPVQLEAIPLWQEQVVVNRSRQKIGQVSVRKTTDVYTVNVPVRSEKLIVEDVESKEILAQIDLSNTEVIQTDRSAAPSAPTNTYYPLVKGHLSQFRDAVSFLEAINQFPQNGFVKSKIALTLVPPKHTDRGLETITHTFESAETALQVLMGLPGGIASRCENVALEIWVRDREHAATYQNWLSRYRQPNSNQKTPFWKLSAQP